MAKNRLPLLVLMLLPLQMLSAGCAHNSQPSVPQSVQPAQRPPLPKEGRQPPTPSICLPTCSAGLTLERENWRGSLMKGVPPAPPVSGTPTRPSPNN
ncbi:hypothetical protein Varpa_2032 [Variovorax paradoxus EPS]|uniref:Uncharacterized protein n=1 Tax=Variovorax paradoxus (strain EPS) TaxID=595537 RepID=E6V9V2_VARPE|nr:hypothetical protein Varpa_2032 [Variovorax paradoxus EPS]